MSLDGDIERVRDLVREAATVAVLSGAGLSAESGVATFRGPGGLWEGRDPMSLATPGAFAEDPELVWRFYQWRRKAAAAVEPNPGHVALARLENGDKDVRLITQNVDGLLQRAGARDVVEVHGSLWTLRCSACGAENRDERLELPPVPACERCGGALRPGVVWFGESLDPASLVAMERACREADLLLVVGTSAVVYPAAGMVSAARGQGAAVVEINLEATPATGICTVALHGKSGEILPRLID